MALKNQISIVLTICSIIGCSLATNLEADHPMLGSWNTAVNPEGQVRIPVQNPEGHSWFIALKMGTPLQRERFCVLENNHALTAVFSDQCTTCPHYPEGYSIEKSTTYFGRTVSEELIKDDGLQLKGHFGMDQMCWGMYGTKKQVENPLTSVCNNNQMFFLVNKELEWNWYAKATDKKHIDALCGLGHEKATQDAVGVIARAAYQNLIRHNAYSVSLVPQKLALPVAYLNTLPQDRTTDQIMRTSFLTLGGWSDKDYTGNITWFNTGGSWNQTLTSFKIDGSTILEKYDLAPVIFEVGYPFIGLGPEQYDKVAAILERKHYNMNCTKGEHWGVCRVKDQTCESLGLNQILTFEINDQEFTIPLENIAVYINHTNNFYCQTQIALMQKAHGNPIVLGAPFFTAFTGMFDTENERIGFAESTRTLPGSSIKCVGESCQEVGPTPIVPEEPETPHKGGGSTGIKVVLVILGLVLLTIACFLAVIWYKKRASNNDVEDDERETGRSKKGKRGYSIKDEKEDDSDEDNLSIDYQKPMLN